MTNEEVKERIASVQPAATWEQSGEWPAVIIEATQWKPLAGLLRQSPISYDCLFCLTCVDWKTHFTMVYHLASTVDRHILVVKVKVDRANPEIESVSDIWRTAELHEREVYDLFGVRFNNHPDLRRLLLTNDFNGHPLRKDFEDRVNMIKL
jgi:NADH/F420H2 dehydrogenase subunit C